MLDQMEQLPERETGSTIQRDAPDNPDRERQNIALWCQRIQADKTHWKDAFNRIRSDQNFVAGEQWGPNSWDTEKYVANLTLRHVAQRTSALYAKNPQATATVKERIEYRAWDGDPETARQAQEMALMAEQQFGVLARDIMPQAFQIRDEYTHIMQLRAQRKRLAKTMELAFKHQIDEQVHPFKKAMKRLVRRVGVTGVGYLVLGYQRKSELSPEATRQIADYQRQLAHLETLAADLEDGIEDSNSAAAEELQRQVQVLQEMNQVLVRDGLTFDFPDSTSVIPHRRCTNLDGFVGANYITLEYSMSVTDIKEVYDIDVSGQHTTVVDTGSLGQWNASAAITRDRDGDRNEVKGEVPVWVVYDKTTRMTFTITSGYPGYLRAPAAPVLDLERFWPVFTLMFNETDHPKRIHPPSDVRLMRQMQVEHNQQRQDQRMHRIANRPKYAVAGVLEDEDKAKLQTHPFNALIELAGLMPGQKVSDLIQRFENAPIDPNVYSTAEVFEDVLRVMGSQEANLGGTSGATATESSIAESSRLSSLQSNVDDLDTFMTEVARCSGQVMLQEMSADTIARIVGPGAVWPELTREEVMEEVLLSIEAGSSGRPNQAQQIQNAERIFPLLIQVPGVKPEFLAKDLIRRLDDRLDLNEAFDKTLPSIMTMNSMSQPGTGDPATEPTAQGQQGSANTAQPGEAPGDQGLPTAQSVPSLPAVA